MNTTIHSKTEARLLANLARLAEVLIDNDGRHLPDYPSVARVTVEFDGCHGTGELIAIDMFPPGADTRPIHPDIMSELLEEHMPCVSGDGPCTLGEFIDSAVLGLLNLRHPGWKEDEGANGEVELGWTTGPDGKPVVTIGGTYQRRILETLDHPFWTDADTCRETSVGKELAYASC